MHTCSDWSISHPIPTTEAELNHSMLPSAALAEQGTGKNKKQGDFLYILVNSESRRASFDLKNVPWEYLVKKDDIDPLSSSSSDVSKQ